MTSTRVGTGFRLALLALLVIGSRDAAADGEGTPMFGLAVVGGEAARTHDHVNGLAGVAFDLAWWHGRFGLAVEGSARWRVDGEGRALVLGGCARFRILDSMFPALMDTRQVEVGLELQAIAEREWWNVSNVMVDPMSHGGGIALRVRGASEPEGTSTLAESRFFLRVMSSRWTDGDAAARTMMPSSPSSSSSRALSVLVGIGASFGGGTKSYMSRFRSRPFGPTLLW